MQTSPRSGRTSGPMQFSASFEIQGSGTIYNTKYILAIGKKLRIETASQWKTRFERKPHFLHSVCKTQCAEMQLIEYSAQSNDLTAPLKCIPFHVHREHQRQRSFQVDLKTNVLAPFTTRSIR